MVGMALITGLRTLLSYLAPPPIPWDSDKDDDELDDEDLKAISQANQGLYETGNALTPNRNWEPIDKDLHGFLHRKAQQHRYSEYSLKRRWSSVEELLSKGLDGQVGKISSALGGILTGGALTTKDGSSWYSGGLFM